MGTLLKELSTMKRPIVIDKWWLVCSLKNQKAMMIYCARKVGFNEVYCSERHEPEFRVCKCTINSARHVQYQS